jgi:hypothetical protein
MQIANLARMGEVLEFAQRFEQNRFMARPIIGGPEGPPHGVIDENGAGRRHLRHDVEHRADYQCGNAARFNDVGDETNGLVAKRSIGDKKSYIDFCAN